MHAHDEIVAQWTARRAEMARFRAAVDGATLCDAILTDLETIRNTGGRELLSLREAATLSRYSVDHLARLIREGSIPNAGRKGAPRIRRQDLPRRPRADLPHGSSNAYDPAADARSLISRRNGGAHGDSSSEA